MKVKVNAKFKFDFALTDEKDLFFNVFFKLADLSCFTAKVA